MKYSLSCAVVLIGLLLGTIGVAVVAGMPVFSGHIEWDRIAGFSLFGFISLLASLVAVTSPRKAGILFLVAVPVMGGCFAWWQRLGPFDVSVLLPRLIVVFAGTSIFFIVPAAFWLITSRFGWPPIVSARFTAGRRILPALTIFLLFLMFAIIGTITSLFLPPFFGGNCYKQTPTVSVQRFPGQIVLAGKIVMVGPVDSSQLASWSLIHIHRRFWGWPSWAPDFVILQDLFKKTEKGDEYFVDARRSSGLLTHFLPIIEIYPCCHTQRLDRATADIRALQDGPPKSGVRIIGRVYTDMYVTSEPARGANVLVAGPGGKTSTTTDQEGIYDLSGLPAGHYSVWVESRFKWEDQRHPSYKAEADVKSGEVWGATLVSCSAPGICDKNR
ncbi:MAG: carboxypeptidase-like regulatory domain-containing protein [Terriglobales bacterium]